MAILHPKYLTCSMKMLECLSSLSPTFSVQSFRFLQFAPLSSSSLFSSAPSLDVIPDFLTKECGFSSSQVTTVMRGQPFLWRKKSDHTAREAIQLLKDSGFTEKQLKNAIVGNPTILALKVDRQLKPKMEFLKKLGIPPQDMPVMISRIPRLLSMNFENYLAPKIFHLETLFGSKDNLLKVLRSRPHFLLSDFKKQVMPRVEYVKNDLGILEGSTKFVQALSAVLGSSFETLGKKTRNIASLGLPEEKIHLILRAEPRLLQSSAKRLKENMEFLIKTAGLMPEIIASRPVILNFSLEKRLKPRYELFEYLKTNPHCKRLPSLVTFLKLSEKNLLSRFGQYTPQLESKDYTNS